MSMESPKFFFSYSREDSEFVLTLAKELRTAGASLWLDQLDILGGQRWDEAVQAALTSCQGMLAVLSPSAVASQNVMDEVSYALEEGKQVIPVRYRECTIPFRLRRVQHVDFVGDYEKGMAALLKALSLKPPEATATPVVTRQGPRQEAQRTVAQEEQRARETEAENREPEQSRSWAETGKPAVQTLSSSAIRHEPSRSRGKAGWIGVFIGALFGTLSALLSDAEDQKLWWLAAIIVGFQAGIVGVITGTNRKVINVALAGAVGGGVIVYLLKGISEAAGYGAPFGAIAGALVGVMLKRIKGWE